MTCVCGLVTQQSVWIAADSAGSDSYSIAISSSHKVFRHCALIFGVAGSLRHMQLLHHFLELPEHFETYSAEAYIVGPVIDAIRLCFGRGELDAKVDAKDHIGCAILIGYQGALYRVNEDYGVLTITRGYDAIGSGDDVAKGALYATPRLPPQERLHCALDAAVEHTPFVRPPYVVEFLSPEHTTQFSQRAHQAHDKIRSYGTGHTLFHRLAGQFS